jgi:hypothetical protein
MKYCILILSAFLVFSSCEKVETPASKTEMLRDKKWRLRDIVKFTRLTDTTFKTDTTRLEFVEPCKKDDYLVFRLNGTGALNTGSEKCPNGEAQESAIKWGITDNETKMYLYDAGEMLLGINDINADISSFSEDRFTIKYMQIIQETKPTPKRDTFRYVTTFDRF